MGVADVDGAAADEAGASKETAADTSRGLGLAEWRWAAPVLAALAAGLIAFGVSHVDEEGVAGGPSSSAATDAPAPNINDITGEDLGLVLGLEPLEGIVRGCEFFAEYKEGAGFCLDGVTNDASEMQLLLLQVAGYQRDEVAERYVEAKTRLAKLQSTDGRDGNQIRDLTERTEELRAQLSR
jgi:hypothetical protein